MENHGITGTSFVDPQADIKLNLGGDSKLVVNDPSWLDKGEPICHSARKQVKVNVFVII